MADDYVLTPYRDDGFFSTPDNGGALPPAPPVESYPTMKPSTADKLWTLGKATAGGIANLVTLPSRAYSGEAAPEEVQNWGPEVASMMIGGGTFGALRGAIGSAGGKLMQGAAEALPAAETAAREPLIAYHGSPHDFDQFDVSKIGTGEGAQAYGHGLYFAENEGVAKSYRDALSSDLRNPVKWGDEKFTPTNEGFMDTQGSLANEYAPGANLAMKALTKYSSSLGQKQFIKQYASSDEEALAAMKLIKQRELQVVDPGHMYQAGINADPAHFLDWDAPMSQQHSKVIDAARQHGMDIGQPVGGPLDELSQAMADRAGIKGFEPAKHEPTGQDFYRHLSDPGAVEASEALRRAGIPGVKYLDAGSRGAGSGSRNYVVFDDATIDILKKYGLAGLGIGGAAAAAGAPKDARASPYVLTPWNGQ